MDDIVSTHYGAWEENKEVESNITVSAENDLLALLFNPRGWEPSAMARSDIYRGSNPSYLIPVYNHFVVK